MLNFLQNYSPFLKYKLLPVTVKMLEIFLETILCKPF